MYINVALFAFCLFPYGRTTAGAKLFGVANGVANDIHGFMLSFWQPGPEESSDQIVRNFCEKEGFGLWTWIFQHL